MSDPVPTTDTASGVQSRPISPMFVCPCADPADVKKWAANSKIIFTLGLNDSRLLVINFFSNFSIN